MRSEEDNEVIFWMIGAHTMASWGGSSSHHFLAGRLGVPLWGVEWQCGDIVPLLRWSTTFWLECYSRCRVPLLEFSGTMGVEYHFRGKVPQ